MPGRTRAAAALVAAAFCAAGCATPAAPPLEPGTVRRVTFRCDTGPDLTVVFAESEARIERPEGGVIVLPQRPAASGIWYETPTHSLRGKGTEITYTVGRRAPMTCQAVEPLPP